MKILNELPPNYKAICKAFPSVKGNPNVVFTWGGTCYVPNGNDSIPKHLEVHENTHSEQQSKVGGPEKWWARYLTDPEFRAQEELQAYQRQYGWIRRRYSRAMRSEFLRRIAGDLSSGMYGKVFDLASAKQAIKGKYAKD